MDFRPIFQACKQDHKALGLFEKKIDDNKNFACFFRRT